MKVVVAVIEPLQLHRARDALAWVGVAGMTVTEVKGFGAEHTEIYRAAEYAVRFVSKVKVEVAVPAPLADRVVAAIQEAVGGGRSDDGAIYVMNVEQITRIRTGETDAAAL